MLTSGGGLQFPRRADVQGGHKKVDHVSTHPGAYETFDEAEAYEAVRDRLRAGGAAPNGVDSECEVMKERARTILADTERESEKDSKAMTPTTPRYNAAVVSAPVADVDEGDDAEEMQEEDRAFLVLAFDTRRKTTTLHGAKAVTEAGGCSSSSTS